jgi:hypothetical protein
VVVLLVRPAAHLVSWWVVLLLTLTAVGVLVFDGPRYVAILLLCGALLLVILQRRE